MKKILSFFIAAVMMLSTSVTSFAITQLNATATVKPRELTEAEKTTYSKYLVEGTKGYMITLDLSELGELVHDDSGLDPSGRKLQMCQLDLVADSESNISRASVRESSLTATANLSKSTAFKENKFNVTFSAAGPEAAYPQSGTATAVTDVYTILVIVSGNVKITPSVVLGVVTYDEGSAVPNTEEQCTINLEPFTLTVGSTDPVGTEIATGVYYVAAKELTGLSDNTKFVIKYETQTKEIEQTLGQILDGEGVGSLTGKLHFAIKPVSVEANTLDFSKFVIETK